MNNFNDPECQTQQERKGGRESKRELWEKLHDAEEGVLERGYCITQVWGYHPHRGWAFSASAPLTLGSHTRLCPVHCKMFSSIPVLW